MRKIVQLDRAELRDAMVVFPGDPQKRRISFNLETPGGGLSYRVELSLEQLKALTLALEQTQ